MASVSSVERFLHSKRANRIIKEKKYLRNLCYLWEINNNFPCHPCFPCAIKLYRTHVNITSKFQLSTFNLKASQFFTKVNLSHTHRGINDQKNVSTANFQSITATRFFLNIALVAKRPALSFDIIIG